MRGLDELNAAGVEAAILEEDYQTAARLLSAMSAPVQGGAGSHVTTARDYIGWLQHLIRTVESQRGHLSQRLAQLRPEAYGRVADAHPAAVHRAGWLGCLAVLGCLLASSLYAGDQKSAPDRQLGAAKRQQDATKGRNSTGSFFQTPWLSEVTARPEVGIASAETTAGQSSGTASFEPPASDCPRIQGAELDHMIARVSLGRVSPKVVSAVIAQESGGRPCAVSHKGAMGLMQIMPDLASDMKLADPFDPEQNVEAGVRYLGQLMERYGGDLRLALAAYNAGPARVDSSGGVPDLEETKAYVSSILRKVQP
jgi:hypothetical protein